MDRLQPHTVVVLDICGTLAPEDSWLALTRDMGASVERHLKVFHDYRAGDITYEESRTQLIGLWRATGCANRQSIRDIFASWPLDPHADTLVSELGVAGFCPLIITGAVDLYAETVAERLGVKDWYANTSLIFDGDELVSYDYDLDQSGKKVRQLEAFCAEHGYMVSEAIAVGDGPNDLGLFRATGHGIWLKTPARPAELREAAWRTVTSLAEIVSIVREDMSHA